ncbi:MAG: hypothetical protein K8S87_02200 [Planctomycetes bacterium]|nr:hypothetical protein [Planctomycetota bacterium]
MSDTKTNDDELLQAFVRLNLTKGVGCTLSSRLIDAFPDIVLIINRSVYEITKINRLSAIISGEI